MCNQIDSHLDTCKALESELRETAAQLDASRTEFANLELRSGERIRQLESENSIKSEHRLHGILLPFLRRHSVSAAALGAELRQQMLRLWGSSSPSLAAPCSPVLQIVIA